MTCPGQVPIVWSRASPALQASLAGHRLAAQADTVRQLRYAPSASPAPPPTRTRPGTRRGRAVAGGRAGRCACYCPPGAATSALPGPARGHARRRGDRRRIRRRSKGSSAWSRPASGSWATSPPCSASTASWNRSRPRSCQLAWPSTSTAARLSTCARRRRRQGGLCRAPLDTGKLAPAGASCQRGARPWPMRPAWNDSSAPPDRGYPWRAHRCTSRACNCPGNAAGLRAVRAHHARAAGPCLPTWPSQRAAVPGRHQRARHLGAPASWPRPPGPARTPTPPAPDSASEGSSPSPDSPPSSTQPASSAPRPPASPGRSASSKTPPAPHCCAPDQTGGSRSPPTAVASPATSAPSWKSAVVHRQQRQSERCPVPGRAGTAIKAISPSLAATSPLTCADPDSPLCQLSPTICSSLSELTQQFLHEQRAGAPEHLAASRSPAVTKRSAWLAVPATITGRPAQPPELSVFIRGALLSEMARRGLRAPSRRSGSEFGVQGGGPRPGSSALGRGQEHATTPGT